MNVMNGLRHFPDIKLLCWKNGKNIKNIIACDIDIDTQDVTEDTNEKTSFA